MTTFPINAPTTPGFTDVTFDLERVVGHTRSPFTFDDFFYVHPASAWSGTVSLPLMKAATAAPWSAFINELDGISGTFLMAPPDRSSPRGTQTANFTVSGAHAARVTSLAVTMTASATLLAGDRISIAQKLYEVATDATADGGGAATLEIRPPLKAAQVGGETIKCDPPEILLRLTSNKFGVKRNRHNNYSLSFAFREG
jgi:hypothetical protein